MPDPIGVSRFITRATDPEILRVLWELGMRPEMTGTALAPVPRPSFPTPAWSPPVVPDVGRAVGGAPQQPLVPPSPGQTARGAARGRLATAARGVGPGASPIALGGPQMNPLQSFLGNLGPLVGLSLLIDWLAGGGQDMTPEGRAAMEQRAGLAPPETPFIDAAVASAGRFLSPGASYAPSFPIGGAVQPIPTAQARSAQGAVRPTPTVRPQPAGPVAVPRVVAPAPPVLGAGTYGGVAASPVLRAGTYGGVAAPAPRQAPASRPAQPARRRATPAASELVGADQGWALIGQAEQRGAVGEKMYTELGSDGKVYQVIQFRNPNGARSWYRRPLPEQKIEQAIKPPPTRFD